MGLTSLLSGSLLFYICDTSVICYLSNIILSPLLYTIKQIERYLSCFLLKLSPHSAIACKPITAKTCSLVCLVRVLRVQVLGMGRYSSRKSDLAQTRAQEMLMCVCPVQVCLELSIFILKQSGSVPGQSHALISHRSVLGLSELTLSRRSLKSSSSCSL